MFLTADNLLSYLEDTGLVATDAWLDGATVITEVGRRNRNFRVHRMNGPSLFLKQVPTLIAETALAFRREAACARLAGQADLATLRAASPNLLRFDAKRQVLVFELIEDARPAAELLVQRDRLDAGLIDLVARTLAGIHHETARHGALAGAADEMLGEAPWVFIIGDKAELVMPNMSAGCRQVVASIRRRPDLHRGLALLGANWRRLCLTHGDFKWDNVLVVDDPAAGRAIRLIDWELANLGDPAWDVAGVLCSLLQVWLLNTVADPVTGRPHGRMGLAPVHDAARRFLDGYTQSGDAALPSLPLALVGALTGARLVLLAFELLPNATALSPAAAAAIELASYFVASPGAALAELLGIGAGVASWSGGPIAGGAGFGELAGPAAGRTATWRPLAGDPQ